MALLVIIGMITLWLLLFILRSRFWEKLLGWMKPKENKIFNWWKFLSMVLILLVITPYLFLGAFVIGVSTMDISTQMISTKDVILFFLVSTLIVLPFCNLFVQTVLEALPVKMDKHRNRSITKRYLYSFSYTLLYFVITFYVVYQLFVDGYINI